MRRHARWLFATTAALFLATLALVWRQPAQQASAPAVPPPAAQPPAAAATPSSAPLPPSPAAAPPPSSFAERRASLDQRAAAGDTEAAAELGGTLAACWRYAPRSREKLEQSVINDIAAGEKPPRPIAGTSPSAELQLLLKERSQRELDVRCGNLGTAMWTWDEAARAPALLERAADAGNVQAMLDYARFAFVDIDGADEVLQQAEEILRRKHKARALLRQALQRGDARALRLLGEAYASGPVEQPDAFAAYVHMSAFFESPAAQDWPPRLRELLLQTLAQRLDAAEVARARQQASQQYAKFQAGGGTR